MIRYLIAAALLCLTVSAQAAVTFGASVTNANGSLTTTLTWDAPGASSCTGSGHPSWDGDKLASGSQALPEITLSGTYSLTLSCMFAGDRTARLTWTPPTQNTDGSALTNLAGYRVYHSTDQATLGAATAIPVTGTEHLFSDLAPGTWYFGVVAVNGQGVASAMSNVTSKTTTDTVSEAQSVTLTVNPVPRAPVAVVE